MTRRFFRHLKFFRRRATLDRDLAEELEFHRAMKQQENETAGLSSVDAQATAQRQMGNLTQAKESSRDTWSFPFLEQLLQDLSVAFRSLRRDRSFTLVAILSLALGIGANTAIFTALDAVLLRPLPYSQPQQLFAISQHLISGPGDQLMDPEFEAWRNENKVFDQLTAWTSAEVDFAGSGSPERIMGASIAGNFLTALRVSPALGRNFSKDENLPNGANAAILTDSFWRQRFFAKRSILGTQIKLNGDSYAIIGILPPSFRFPGNIVPELLIPAQLPAQPNWGATILRGLNVLGRLRPGITLDRAEADLHLISKNQESAMPAWMHHVRHNFLPLRIVPLQTYLAGDTRWTLLLLLTAVVLLLTIACANVTNLLLSRATARQSELALRSALGAGRGRLVRFLLTESLTISLLGGSCGILLAWVLLRLLRATTFLHITTAVSLHIDGAVLPFTLLISVVVGVACGLFPALLASKPVLHFSIKGGEAKFSHGTRFRSFFVISEVGLTLVLMVAALLLLRSLHQVFAVNPGFQPENTLSFQTNFPDARERQNTAMFMTVQSELERLASLPGVRSVGATSSLLLASYHRGASIVIEGQPTAPPGQRPSAPVLAVSPDYFRTVRIPLLAGRAFSRSDSAHSLPVAMVNVSFAHRFFGRIDPIGKRLQQGEPSDNWVTVVGIVGDAHHDGRETAPNPELYLPYAQNRDFLQSSLGIALRTTLPPATLLPAIRKLIAKTDPTQPIFDIATMQQRLSESTSSRRTQAALLSSFAFTALCLAAIGVYGVLAYAVRQTTREIGIRMALGAQKATVLRDVIHRGIFLALAGIAIGLTISLATVRYLTSFLFHVKPLDWISFTASAALLLVLAILASYIPARRAANVDPMTALRYE